MAFAEEWNIKKIVFTSSIAPYGAAEELKKEITLPTPNTAYGISKLVAEKIHEKWQNGDVCLPRQKGYHQGLHLCKGVGALHAVSLGTS